MSAAIAQPIEKSDNKKKLRQLKKTSIKLMSPKKPIVMWYGWNEDDGEGK
ncbi:hypothetical protein [Laceyella sacchari]|jgi:hypothetical protein|uniref:Uncharacterized protein n=1 Tax=Laceyella sacchari TaxID=37482 RepID=A0ABY5U4F7_LACSH|nr:hypothetical protein [Laceyella sacchari]TCW40912.1 hypothetical protein EDC32_101566 [Laceyella sacchari]UWE04522.1 hypothetical protein NYR52_05085 [Laceyella sacchari]